MGRAAPILRIEVSGLEDIKRKLTGGGPFRRNLLSGPLRTGLQRIGQGGELLAKREVPVDTGDTRRGLTHQVDQKDPPEFVRIGSDKQVARYVHGDFDEPKTRSKPHFPPIAALEGWARRHGIPVFAVQRAIGRRGTPFNPFLTRIIPKVSAITRGAMSKAAREIEKLWSGR